jgi:hypothetical protein
MEVESTIKILQWMINFGHLSHKSNGIKWNNGNAEIGVSIYGMPNGKIAS